MILNEIKRLFAKAQSHPPNHPTGDTLLQDTVPDLIPLNLEPEEQDEIKQVYPEVESLSRKFGKYQLAIKKARDLRGKKTPLRTFVVKGIWFGSYIACTVVNVRAVQTTIPEEVYWLKAPMMFGISAFVVFYLDWVIGSESEHLYLKRTTKKEEQKLLEAIKREDQGDLTLALATGALKAFERVQGKYLTPLTLVSQLKLAGLGTLYVVEYTAAILIAINYGEGNSFGTYIAPFIGILLSGFSGFFKGMMIELPRQLHYLANRYLGIAEEDGTIQLKKDVLLANEITGRYLTNPNISRDEIQELLKEQAVAEREAAQKIPLQEKVDEISSDYNESWKQLTKQHQEQRSKLEEQLDKQLAKARHPEKDKRYQALEKRKNRLLQRHLSQKIELIETILEDLQDAYRQYPSNLVSYIQFLEDLNIKKKDYQAAVTSLEQQWLTLNNLKQKTGSSNNIIHFDQEGDDKVA